MSSILFGMVQAIFEAALDDKGAEQISFLKMSAAMASPTFIGLICPRCKWSERHHVDYVKKRHLTYCNLMATNDVSWFV